MEVTDHLDLILTREDYLNQRDGVLRGGCGWLGVCRPVRQGRQGWMNLGPDRPRVVDCGREYEYCRVKAMV
jgi:hypothetical protein